MQTVTTKSKPTTTAPTRPNFMAKKSELWQRLRAARGYAEKTQLDIAKALDVSRPTVALWESRNPSIRTNPSGQQVMAFAKQCRLPPTFLVDDNADPEDIYAYARRTNFSDLDTLPAPLSDEAAAQRQAKAFWSAVEFKVVAQNPALAGCFEAPIDAQSVSLRADYLHAKNVVEFASPGSAQDDGALMQSVARLLVLERATGRTLAKHVMVYTRTGQFNVDGQRTFELTFGVTVQAYNDIDKAAEFLVGL